ncbi:MAG: bifunctional riboflavin kinase/FAD synthetase [Candidatus Palauibacterales bacterium]|nr:bifunctional riboflavin kinase/FAD synthetase [Candidatus Palauibacterales bacterium]MDP2530504.1 bifunctional riboflavin kinase/FAD synthetase [Candidatus Palauibacterales bacterium]MDP2582937.1 bifunctional riboflavin kinase/FAD synthetase [Candidatus Palauibacterales bacterium]
MRAGEGRPAGGGPSGLPPEVGGTVLTVGTFDGVHRGHRAVLAEIVDRAGARGLSSVLVTFDRHPLTVVRPEQAPALLTTPDEKKEILAQTGLDYVAFLRFTRALSRYSPEAFVRTFLVGRFRVRELVIGYDHGFGRDRSGDIQTLRRLGTELGFDVDVVGDVSVAGGSISSTRIRQAVGEGRMEDAALGLGRPYSIQAPIVHGQGRGRDLGFPTANLQPPGGAKLLPPPGIYAVRASLRTEIRKGVVHLGPRPTFPGSPPSIELYLLDFDGDLYGEPVRVEFLSRLRDVLPFTSAAELVQQMREDVREARAYFAASGT